MDERNEYLYYLSLKNIVSLRLYFACCETQGPAQRFREALLVVLTPNTKMV